MGILRLVICVLVAVALFTPLQGQGGGFFPPQNQFFPGFQQFQLSVPCGFGCQQPGFGGNQFGRNQQQRPNRQPQRQPQQQGNVPWIETQGPAGGQQGEGQVPWQEVFGGLGQQGGQGQQGGNQGGGGRPGNNSGCSCTTTSEYNPVCGSDNTTYSNPGRFNCAVRCQSSRGQTPVTLVHYGVCRTAADRG